MSWWFDKTTTLRMRIASSCCNFNWIKDVDCYSYSDFNSQSTLMLCLVPIPNGLKWKNGVLYCNLVLEGNGDGYCCLLILIVWLKLVSPISTKNLKSRN